MDSPSFGKLLKIVTSTNIKININISEAVTFSQHLSIVLCYLATWNYLWRPAVFYLDMITVVQTEGYWMNVIQYCHRQINVSEIALHLIDTICYTILITAQHYWPSSGTLIRTVTCVTAMKVCEKYFTIHHRVWTMEQKITCRKKCKV